MLQSYIPLLRYRFSVKFYLVAMLVIVFDIEVVFMVWWAVAFRQLPAESGYLLGAMGFLLSVLTVGLVYAWKRGALEWA